MDVGVLQRFRQAHRRPPRQASGSLVTGVIEGLLAAALISTCVGVSRSQQEPPCKPVELSLAEG